MLVRLRISDELLQQLVNIASDNEAAASGIDQSLYLHTYPTGTLADQYQHLQSMYSESLTHLL